MDALVWGAGTYVAVSLAVIGWLIASRDKAKDAAKHFQEAYGVIRDLASRFGLLTDSTRAVLFAAQLAAENNNAMPAAVQTIPDGSRD